MRTHPTVTQNIQVYAADTGWVSPSGGARPHSVSVDSTTLTITHSTGFRWIGNQSGYDGFETAKITLNAEL